MTEAISRDVKIKKGKPAARFRGMLCSIAELGLTLHMPQAVEDGILIRRTAVLARSQAG
ncbi:MAG: hypothetical protein ACLUFM_04540 [Lachnospiraceae bacterium]